MSAYYRNHAKIPVEARLLAYTMAMEQLTRRYPDDFEAWVAHAEGAWEEAVQLMRAAADGEDGSGTHLASSKRRSRRIRTVIEVFTGPLARRRPLAQHADTPRPEIAPAQAFLNQR